MTLKMDQGINYSLRFLQKNGYPQVLFWLGIKPLNFEDLYELLTNVSTNRLISIIEDLQENYLVSPIEEAGCFILTDGGRELAELTTSLGIWGSQQVDENNGKNSGCVVLPDSTMAQHELLKYRSEIGRYL